jgi:hypothetical protein
MGRGTDVRVGHPWIHPEWPQDISWILLGLESRTEESDRAGADGVAQVIEHLPSQCEALS